jgi:GDPmannose 4,6-dehydratase
MGFAKTAFVTGITGQDGAYLAQLLVEKNYNVHGLVRWDCVDGTARLQELGLTGKINLYHGDLCDAPNIFRLIKEIAPDEIYNLAALSHVKVSFEAPSSAFDINTKGTLNILETVRILDLKTKIYQASSSEMFGNAPAPQNEQTPFSPCSPYGVAKLASYWLARTYRDSYKMFVCNGILFNHESPLRGEDFVTQKIVKSVVAIESGQQEKLILGNLDSRRDWGHARDYVEGIWSMMQHEKPDDFILATGRAHTVRDFVEQAFAHAGIKIKWQGAGLSEIGIDEKTGKILLSIDSDLFRPNEIHHLLGDASKAQAKLGWNAKTGFSDLVADMMNAERERYWRCERSWQKAG